MTSATADCSTVAPLTTPENECLAPAGNHPTFALVGLASDDQQRTTPICIERGITFAYSSRLLNLPGTNGRLFVMRGNIDAHPVDQQ
jgi:hypothetical protein